MKEIELSQGKIALVDDRDFEWLNQSRWYAKKNGGRWQAELIGGTPMHRLIMGATFGQIVKHKNPNGLDNQRKNLYFSGGGVQESLVSFQEEGLMHERNLFAVAREIRGRLYSFVFSLPFVTDRLKLPRESGVYLLVQAGEIVYVGQSSNIWKRWAHGDGSRGWGKRDFPTYDGDIIHYLCCHTLARKVVEGFFIFTLQPRYNKTVRPMNELPEADMLVDVPQPDYGRVSVVQIDEDTIIAIENLVDCAKEGELPQTETVEAVEQFLYGTRDNRTFPEHPLDFGI